MPKTENTNPSPIAVSYTYRGNEYTVNFDATVPPSKIGAIVEYVADGLVDDMGNYRPYLYGVLLNGNILEACSDFDMSIGYDELGVILIESNLILNIERSSFGIYLLQIKKHADELVEFKKQRIIHTSKFDELADYLLKLVSSFGESFDPETMKGAMENLSKLSNISQDDVVKQLIDASGVTKGKAGRKPKSNSKTKGNVTNLVQFRGQQVLEGEEVADGIPVE